MSALRTKFIAYRLDYHWIFIRKYREKMLTLYEQGVGLCDEKMLALKEKFNHHCIKAMKLEAFINYFSDSFRDLDCFRFSVQLTKNRKSG